MVQALDTSADEDVAEIGVVPVVAAVAEIDALELADDHVSSYPAEPGSVVLADGNGVAVAVVVGDDAAAWCGPTVRLDLPGSVVRASVASNHCGGDGELVGCALLAFLEGHY